MQVYWKLMLVLYMHFRVPMENLIGIKGEKALLLIGFTKQLVSMGHQACGALELWHYPTFLRDLVLQDINIHDRPDHVYLPALEYNRRYTIFNTTLNLI